LRIFLIANLGDYDINSQEMYTRNDLIHSLELQRREVLLMYSKVYFLDWFLYYLVACAFFVQWFVSFWI